ncbi:MAG TPA: type 1 glutamine amidotransferase [Acidimicrobiales bacterium]|nr:type 1 glutamine amidotransferase [Acidimicrobiales bacterium]
MTTRIAVVQHEDRCPLGLFARWWSAPDLVLDVRRPYAGDPLPEAGEAEGLVVLGGSMAATDDDRHGWLAGTRDLLREAVAVGVPTLGICLGHQMLAVACGGRVERNPAGKQMGVLPLGRTATAADDRLLGPVPPTARVLQWNDDIVVAVPPGARVLAATRDGVPQALRVGPAAWGVQFHPEADGAIVAGWAEPAGGGRAPTPGAPEALAGLRVAEAELAATWRPFANRFAAIAAEHTSPR